ncbi:heat stress transcription factor A-1e [Abrus precatorius]|uniref:Heat stress transcription factor A-1e n=1 Tax=Abrus precatorius TaxID=3816 RepID=A0A8B8LY78_ABRPR|nr:heat stress transcription factor A-1e [Abrus precatorius]
MEGASWNSVSVAPFLSKTYDMVDDPSTDSIVSWGDNNNSFVVWNVPQFSTHILPNHFKHNNFSSFVRQLNTYGFRKVDPDRWEFANEGFLRGKKQLLKSISRRKSAHVNGTQQPSQVHNSPVRACVEVGKFGLEEEVGRLKRDKNVLMQELVRLRQKQQVTDNQLQNVGQRVQAMEQRQQQMMSFLAKAMHSPGFLAQFVQQQNESNRQITGGNKKRRLHGQEEDSLATKELHNAFDGHVVKYQTSINEAAKALFRQILQINNSKTTESSIKNPDVFLLDDVPSAIALDSSSSSTQVSDVILSVVPPISELTCMEVGSQFPANCMPSSISEEQSSPAMLADSIKTTEFPELSLHNCQENVSDLCKSQEMETESSLLNHNLNVMGAEIRNMEDIDMMSAVLDGTDSIEADHFSPDAGEISKLPGINDEFWELFLRPSPVTADMEETKCSSLGCDLIEDLGFPSDKENKQEKIDKIQHVERLTQQMGLLASES